MEQRVRDLLRRMTLAEKVSLTTGRDMWHTNGIERLGIPSVALNDGPHGIRKPRSGETLTGDSPPATCFPTACALASSWDVDLAREVGGALGEEAVAQGVGVLLGPGLNIKRTPLCGRNFEYFSEDPVLTGEMAAAFVQGLQGRGAGACLKHYACNNQEYERMTVSAECDERTLREIYLAGFERAVRQAAPWAVMAAYNKVNGSHATENAGLLRRILKEEWRFDGCVVSDWGAVNDKGKALLAGLDLEMPGPGPHDRLVELVQNGVLPEAVLDEAVARILGLVLRSAPRSEGSAVDQDGHHALARRACAESMVLLKNEGDFLPLPASSLGSLAVLGRLARYPRYQGAGSSRVTPTRLDTPYEALSGLAPTAVRYADGYPEGDGVDEGLLREAAALAGASAAAVVFVGLPEDYEAEGLDRRHIDLPAAHNRLIEAVCRVQPRTVVVLQNGSPVAMPWVEAPWAIVESWLGGQAAGGAIADVLLGRANPCGKLAETFPVKLADTPAHLHYPGELGRVRYGEGLFVGYRYYDKKEMAPLFPFGHGLSYTTFQYVALELDRSHMTDDERLELGVTVRNTGRRSGKEVVQVYLRDVEARVIRPVKELKAFAKVELAPGEEKVVRFTLQGRDFAFFDDRAGRWLVGSGEFAILVGSSSRDIRLKGRVVMNSSQRLATRFDQTTLLKDLLRHPVARGILEGILPAVLNIDPTGDKPDLLAAMALDMPIGKLVRLSGGRITDQMAEAFLEYLNSADA